MIRVRVHSFLGRRVSLLPYPYCWLCVNVEIGPSARLSECPPLSRPQAMIDELNSQLRSTQAALEDARSSVEALRLEIVSLELVRAWKLCIGGKIVMTFDGLVARCYGKS